MNRIRANKTLVPSEVDAKEKLVVYVYEYLTHCGAKNAAMTFLNEINCMKEIQVSHESPGFLADWWCVFWDLYCAAPQKGKAGQMPEPSSEARAMIDMRNVMSPNCSPPQQQPPFMNAPGGPGPRYGGPMPPHGPHIRSHPPRMHGPPQGVPNGPYMAPMSNSPRYAPQPNHMTPPGPAGNMYPEPGPSPVSRMTPSHSGSPHPQLVQTPQMSGPPSGSGQIVSGPMMPMQGQRPGPPPQQQNWQGGNQMSYSMNSPVAGGYIIGPSVSSGNNHNEMGGMPMMNDNGMMEVKTDVNNGPPTPQSTEDTYVIPSYQEPDQNEQPDMMKVKQNFQDPVKQQEFGGDYNEFQGKGWS